MNTALLRYSCQINLPGFGEAVQQKLTAAKVLVAGAGGLGCPAAQYLAASGIGNLIIADDDVISISNLHRQVLYTPAEAGRKKAVVAAQKLQSQNPGITVIPLDTRITVFNVLDIIATVDIIVDCTDNFETRYLLNDACVMQNKPLVYGAIYQYEGQVATWNLPGKDGDRTPNYRDIFPEADPSQVPDCAEGGVLPTLAGIIGTMQANEVVKYLTGIGELLAGRLLIFDAQTWQSRIIKIGTKSRTGISVLTPTTTVPLIAVDTLKEKMHAGNYVLVDVRNMQERNSFNIGGLHIPLNELAGRMQEIPGTGTIIFYCASGKRSSEAAKQFMQHYPSVAVFSLNGGTKAWLDAVTV